MTDEGQTPEIRSGASFLALGALGEPVAWMACSPEDGRGIRKHVSSDEPVRAGRMRPGGGQSGSGSRSGGDVWIPLLDIYLQHHVRGVVQRAAFPCSDAPRMAMVGNGSYRQMKFHSCNLHMIFDLLSLSILVV